MTPPEKSVEQLEAELAEAERIVASLREQIDHAKWIKEYTESQA